MTDERTSGIVQLNNPAGQVVVIGLVLTLMVGIIIGVVATNVVTADGNDPAALLDKVTEGQRYGFPADVVGEEVCFFLIKEDRTAETRKSCIARDQALNLGEPHEELDAVEVKQGSGVFQISRDRRYGVYDGVVLEPVDEEQLPPPPTPTPSPSPESTEAAEQTVPTDLPSTGGS